MPGGAAAEYVCMMLWSVAALVSTLPEVAEGMRGTFLTIGDALDAATGGSSFVAGTKVATPDGDRPIESLRPGDIVIARDERSGASRSQRVTQIFKRIAPAVLWLTLAAPVEASPGLVAVSTAEPLAKVETIGVTGEHPLYVEGRGWVAASDLVKGDRIVALSGPSLEVMAVRFDGSSRTVYNLEVASDATYFVGEVGAWGHNATWPTNPDDLDDIVGTRGKSVPDKPNTPGRKRKIWQLSKCTRIRYEQHPYNPIGNPKHDGPHYHIDVKSGGSWDPDVHGGPHSYGPGDPMPPPF